MPSAAPTARSARPPGPSARERLLVAALRRFGEAGVVAVTLDEIREAAGVSVGALYHHFADKEALIDALYLDLTADVHAGFLQVLRSHPGAKDGVTAIVRYYIRWVTRERAGAAILLGHRPQSPALKELNRQFFSEVLGWWATHVHYGTLRALPLDLIHALWLGPAQEYSRHWLAGHVKKPPASATELLADCAWNALKEDT
jgi:AcrR family transcriptional regulator